MPAPSASTPVSSPLLPDTRPTASHARPCPQAFYRLTDYRSQIKAYVFDVVRASVPKILLDDVFLVSPARL